MRTSSAMENLLLYLQSLPKSNRKWLSDKLIEGLHEEESDTISKKEVLAGIDRGLKEMIERKKTGKKAKTLEELIHEL
ncbi:surface protein [Marseilla massiliensis]|uniref:Surface protein n=1 Tax=Marseilla massiliensis TaxID=1841864 RepID=A0A938WTV1_9BACT|nr:surface protein [Marseilla massiliensis]MBM6673069.1 surface protein [Marseilla massiliensis]